MPSAVIPSVHSYAALRLAPQLLHQRYVHPGPLVLRTAPLNTPTPAADRDRTVSRRSEPSSRTTLNGEQPYPWDLLQPQDVMSRHRGAKRLRRYGLLGVISLLSPQPAPPTPPLRYPLGGARPSQTTRHAGSRLPLKGDRLDARKKKGGIS